MRIWFLLFLTLAMPGFAADRITALVTVTGATADGNTITVNGNVRTWKTTVTVPATQIVLGASANAAKTNLYSQIGLNPFGSVVILDQGAAAVSLVGSAGTFLTVTTVGGWATVTYSTQSVAVAVAARVPYSVEVAAQQTNITSGIAAMVGAIQNTNVISAAAPAMTNFVSVTNLTAQVVYGQKLMTNVLNVYAGRTTNGLNVGDAFSSVGSALHSEQFGLTALATGVGSAAFGYQAAASAQFAYALGGGAIASGIDATAAGTLAVARNANDSAFGTAASALGTNSTALGALTTVAAGHTNSTAVGYGATTTAANQIMLGGSGINAIVQNAISVGAGGNFVNGITNLWLTGTNTFPAGADIAFGRYALTTLVNSPGANADIIIGTNVFVEVSGPSAAFTVHGIAGGRNGKFVIILNRTGQNMTIANESGTDGVAANRILTSSGGDTSTSGNGAVLLIYSASSSRWMVVAFYAAASGGSGGSPWLITGNQGGISSANFIGTTDSTPLTLRVNSTAITLSSGTVGNLIVNSDQGTIFSPNLLVGGTANSGCSVLGGDGNVMGGGGSQSFSTIANGDSNSISNSNDSFVAGQSIRMDTKARTGVSSSRPSIGLGYNYVLQDAGVLFFGDKQQPSAGTPYVQSWIDDAVVFRAQHGTYLLGGLNVGWTNLPDNGSVIVTNWAVIGTTNRYATTNIFGVDSTVGQSLTINNTSGWVESKPVLVAATGLLVRSNTLASIPTLNKGDNFYWSSNGVAYVITSSPTGVLATNKLGP